MPYHINYQIGDKVYNKRLGEGIVLGQKPKANAPAGMTIYHVYYYDHDIFWYAITATMTKLNNATDESRDEARQILLTKLAASTKDNMPRHYHMGDIFVYQNKTHIILDNGRLYNGHVRYHICRLSDAMLQYSSLDTGYATKPATKFTIKHAKNILRDYFLIPAFS